jgi:hypothetical protein
MRPAVLGGAGPQRHALGGNGVRERGVPPAGEHPAAVHRRTAAVRNPGHRLFGSVRFGQRVVVDQGHVVAGVPGGRGLRREVLIGTAGTKRIGGHEEQHHASMGNCRLRQGADHETRRRSSNSPRAEY